MIGFLKGRLAVKQPPMLMVDVNGVGYELEAPMSTFYGLPAAGEPVALFTHLVVREDAHILYAFGTDGERRQCPRSVGGIGCGADREDQKERPDELSKVFVHDPSPSALD